MKKIASERTELLNPEKLGGGGSVKIPIKMYSRESNVLDRMQTTCVSVCVRQREKKRDIRVHMPEWFAEFVSCLRVRFGTLLLSCEQTAAHT